MSAAETDTESITLTVGAYAKLAKPVHLIDKPAAELARATGIPGRALCGAALPAQPPMPRPLVEAYCKGCLIAAGVRLPA